MPSSRARRWRWTVRVGYWAAQALGVYVFLSPIAWMAFEDLGGGLQIALTVGVILFYLGLQALFLLPVRRPRARATGWPILLSMAVAGLWVGVLVGAFGFALFTVAELYGLDLDESVVLWGLLIAMVVSWLVSTPLLVAFCRGRRRESALHRVASGLFVGTMVEAIALIPLDVMVRRKEDCHCATGTYYALIACGVVGLFTLGPAIFVPLMARRRKRYLLGHCEICGYDMASTPNAQRCPECGCGWRGGTD